MYTYMYIRICTYASRIQPRMATEEVLVLVMQADFLEVEVTGSPVDPQNALRPVSTSINRQLRDAIKRYRLIMSRLFPNWPGWSLPYRFRFVRYMANTPAHLRIHTDTVHVYIYTHIHISIHVYTYIYP